MLFIAEIQQGRCQRLKIWENTGQYPELKFANVAQRQSSGFVNQGLSVRIRPLALETALLPLLVQVDCPLISIGIHRFPP